jgi:hypothetical protein
VEVVEMMWWGHGNGSAYAVMLFGMIAFWAMVVWAVIAIRRTNTGHAAGESGERRP